MNTALMPPRPRKAISLTALIDVVFILLMFFMLTSSFTQWRATSLHSATAKNDGESASRPALIVLHPDGSLTLNRIDGEILTPSLLRDRISRDRDTVLLPAADTSIQTLVGNMEALREAGFDRLAVGESVPIDKND